MALNQRFRVVDFSSLPQTVINIMHSLTKQDAKFPSIITSALLDEDEVSHCRSRKRKLLRAVRAKQEARVLSRQQKLVRRVYNALQILNKFGELGCILPLATNYDNVERTAHQQADVVDARFINKSLHKKGHHADAMSNTTPMQAILSGGSWGSLLLLLQWFVMFLSSIY